MTFYSTSNLPHISFSKKNKKYERVNSSDNLKKEQHIQEKSNKCWKALLHNSTKFPSSFAQEEKNEWDVVYEYYDYQKFLKTSSNKVRY